MTSSNERTKTKTVTFSMLLSTKLCADIGVGQTYVMTSHRHGNAATSLLDMACFGPHMAVRHSVMEMPSNGLLYEAYSFFLNSWQCPFYGRGMKKFIPES